MPEHHGSALHLPTAYLTAGILYILFSFAAWLILRAQARRAAYVWSGGGILMGLGFILVGLRNELTPALSYPGAVGLLVGGSLLRVVALGDELKQSISNWTSLLLFLGIMGPFEFFRLVLESPGLRFLWGGISLCVLIGYVGLLSWRLAAAEGSFSARWIAIAYTALTFSMLARLLGYLFGMNEPDALAETVTGSVMMLCAMFASAIGNAGFIGLYLERSSRRNLAYAVLEDRQLIAARFRDQITSLDRERVMVEVSSSLAHELGQPIMGILADINCVKARRSALMWADPQADDALENMQRHALRAREIIAGIRGLSKPDDGQWIVIELESLLQRVFLLLDSPGSKGRVRFRLRTSGASPKVLAHEILLSLVFINLFRNSIEAVREPGVAELIIEIHSGCGEVTVVITDNGPGFSEEALQQAFEPFFTSKTGGLGIGLALSKRIVSQHEGSLVIRNRDHPVGAVVELRLPLATALVECSG